MLDVAPSEFLMVAFVALVVIGPKDLPKAMRVVGYWVGRARGVARQFRSGFDSMVREAELEEMEKRWAAENERIMREHSGASAPADAPPAGETADPSSSGVASADDVDPGPSEVAPGDPAPTHVEKPAIAATGAPSAARDAT